jgi:Kef-type K+ transport system membrane component KefB
MTSFLQLAISLALIITISKIGGYLSYRIGQPAVLGELLVGILIGPSVIDFFHFSFFTDQHLPEVIHEMAEIGVLLLMFMAGLDLHLSELVRSTKVAALAGTLGVIFPLFLGVITGLLFSLNSQSAIFVGLILAATSVSISAQTLMELKMIRSRVGTSLLGAAVFDDILVILGMSIFIALANPDSSGGLRQIALIITRMVLFLGISSAIGWWVLPRISNRIQNQPISQGLIAFVFVTILLYSWFAEIAGHMSGITGAFLAGLWFSRTTLKERIRNNISTIAYGVFVPIFFINIGLSANARLLTLESSFLLMILAIVAIGGKIVGAGWGAKLGGLTRQESIQLGVGMISRGEVGLIVATVGVTEGYIQSDIFSVILGIVILTTVITPIFLRKLFSNVPSSKLMT